MKKILFLLCVWGILPLALWGQVALPNVFGDHMVLQQGKKVALWGTAAPGERVTVKFGGQTKRTVADADGKWRLALDELTASDKPRRLTVSGRKNRVTFENVLVGEVWLASGQSNMEYSMNNHPRYAKPLKGDRDYLFHEWEKARNPRIRVLYVRKELKGDTLPTDGWKVCAPENVAAVSAAAYFFAQKLAAELQVPVGIISTSWGGTPIETWTSEEAYRASDTFAGLLKDGRLGRLRVGERYDKMVAPLVPYTLKGFLWYQGETNLINGDLDIYAAKQQVLIESWRKAWADAGLPFYYVQLAPYAYTGRRSDLLPKAWDALPRFWQVQASCLKIPNTGMVGTTDLVEDLKDIHPTYKWVVGERLARLALAKDYGRDTLVYSGPVCERVRVEKERVLIEFTHTGSGLTTRDGKAPDWFSVKTTKNRFEPAETVIEGNKIILTHPRLQHPVSVRFGWDEAARPNLMNKEGLPARPFLYEE